MYYFPSPDDHIIGDSAFPLSTWLMTPYKRSNNLGEMELHHNKKLSADRVCIENTFGLIKGRWRRLFYIDVFNVAKAVEIITAACILHNFCYRYKDGWDNDNDEFIRNETLTQDNGNGVDDSEEAREKRNIICQSLFSAL